MPSQPRAGAGAQGLNSFAPLPAAYTRFLVGTFQIPPFLLPIYQAAGIQYDVPWQILAAINWIETDYGRNLSVSSAGAVGWMQFMPSTWARYGVDLTGAGTADPYDPIDAIFAAARYLHAAGAGRSLPGAIHAYDHADWYVRSVLLRAELIGAYPAALIDALTGLMEARFPLAGRVRGYRHQLSSHGPMNDREILLARPGAAAVAAADGTILSIGRSPGLGNYAILEDTFGNRYLYAGLGRTADLYAIPKQVPISSARTARQLGSPGTAPPSGPATAGLPGASAPVRDPVPARPAAAVARRIGPGGDGAKERLFAHPLRPASYASGGHDQITVIDPGSYLASALTLRPGQYTLAPLRRGATVPAGTTLGRLDARGSMTFMIYPAGKHSAPVDPAPILRSWQLAGAAGIYGADARSPLIDPGAHAPTIGQILLMSKGLLERRVLVDPGVRIYACGRRDIGAGLVDRRVLAAIEYLSVLGLRPTISGLVCGQGQLSASGTRFSITRFAGTAVRGHQGPRSLAALAVHALLALQGAMRPAEIISLHSHPGQPNTVALPDHAGRIEVDYPTSTATPALDRREWSALISQLQSLAEPALSTAPVTRHRRHRG
ncbi:MAG TPA: lytic murein transglycosylase [Solirubrobacteraceae bacterium]